MFSNHSPVSVLAFEPLTRSCTGPLGGWWRKSLPLDCDMLVSWQLCFSGMGGISGASLDLNSWYLRLRHSHRSLPTFREQFCRDPSDRDAGRIPTYSDYLSAWPRFSMSFLQFLIVNVRSLFPSVFDIDDLHIDHCWPIWRYLKTLPIRTMSYYESPRVTIRRMSWWYDMWIRWSWW